jgi:hypothetical protein
MMKRALLSFALLAVALTTALLLHNAAFDRIWPTPDDAEIQGLQARFDGTSDDQQGAPSTGQVIFFRRPAPNSGLGEVIFARDLPHMDDTVLKRLENDLVRRECPHQACYGAFIVRYDDEAGATPADSAAPEAATQAAPVGQEGDETATESASNLPSEEQANAEAGIEPDADEGNAAASPSPSDPAAAAAVPASATPGTTASHASVVDVSTAVLARWTTAPWWPQEVSVEHSRHSFARLIEKVLLNKPGTSADEVKLCAGSRKPPLPGQCKWVGDASQRLQVPSDEGASLDDLESRMSHRAMIQGLIQFIIIAWAAATVLSLLFVPGFSLLRRHKPRQFDWAASQDRIDAYLDNESGAKPLGLEDRLILPAMITVGSGAPADKGALLDDLSRARVAMRDEVEDGFEFATRAAEHLLKAALFGTALGISRAIFESRGTQSADVVDSMLVQARMLASLAIGFGTTILGVVGSGLITELRGWRMDRLFDEIDDAVNGWSASISATDKADLKSDVTSASPVPTIRSQMTGLLAFGGTSILVIVLALIAAIIIGGR